MVTETYKVKVQVDGERQLKNLNNSTLRIQKSLGGLGTAAKIAGGAIAAIGVTRAIGGFIEAGKTVEELQLRLKLLLGSAEEGAEAFDLMNEFAGRVPFTLDSIAASANNLAVVSDNAQDLQNNLELTANIAAAFGLDMQTAGEQVQRALSGGIASADIFRERGVSAFAGFQQGVSYSAEETARILNEVFGEGGRGSGAIDEFAGSLTGQVSMVQDAFTRFQQAVASGFFDELKAQFGDLQTFLNDNEQAIKDIGVALGKTLAASVRLAGSAIKFVKDNLDLVAGFSAFIALNVAGKFIAISRAIAAVVVTTRSLVALSGVGLAAVAASVAAGTAAYIGMNKVIDELEGNVNDANESLAGSNGFAAGQKGAAVESAKLTAELEAQEKALDDIISSQGNAYGGAYMDSVHKADKSLKDHTETVEEVADAYELAAQQGAAFGGAGMDAINKKAKEVDDVFANTTMSVENFQNIFKARFKQLSQEFNPVLDGVNLLIGTFDTFKQGVGDAFADAILGAKSFAESIEQVGKAILKQLISGLIQIGLEVFVFEVLAEKMRKVRDEQNSLNAALGIELGLRTALAFFTGGGSLFAGFFAEGGKIPAGKFGVVGEEGPELIGGPATVTPIPGTAQAQTTSQGDVQINFNISTVDAESFDDLLVSRRGIITSIINDGLERQGRTALI